MTQARRCPRERRCPWWDLEIRWKEFKRKKSPHPPLSQKAPGHRLSPRILTVSSEWVGLKKERLGARSRGTEGAKWGWGAINQGLSFLGGEGRSRRGEGHFPGVLSLAKALIRNDAFQQWSTFSFRELRCWGKYHSLWRSVCAMNIKEGPSLKFKCKALPLKSLLLFQIDA